MKARGMLIPLWPTKLGGDIEGAESHGETKEAARYAAPVSAVSHLVPTFRSRLLR